MTRIKFCGLSRACDIVAANELMPDYIGFVFAPKSRRYVDEKKAAALRALLHPDILAVGVFVKEETDFIARLLQEGVIDIVQLHGNENESYLEALREKTDKPVIQAFGADSGETVRKAKNSQADFILFDSAGGGTGQIFDWNVLAGVKRPYFLAGGLNAENAEEAVRALHPYAVDVSSGIETNGVKDREKMRKFAAAVRAAAGKDEKR